jgi:DNA-binding YbaB/EbfC family protein
VKNIGQLMKQAQQMQTRMAEMQAKLGELEMTGQSGGGMVTAVMNGKGDLRTIKLEKAAVDPDDIEMLEDLIIAAIADAKGKVESHVAAETQKLMGGMPMPPGMKLPF